MFRLIPRRPENARLARYARLHAELDQLFGHLFGRVATSAGELAGGPSWGFQVEEKESEFVFRTDAPGFEARDFDLQLHGETLTVKAERKSEAKEGQPQHVERRLQRSVTLPEGVDANKVEARYVNGVLEVRLGKSEQAQPKKITVQG
jgi:HSP20 family protein